MNCVHCGGHLRWETAPFHVDRHGYHVQWDAVPAFVCGQCGEAFFDEKAVEAIQEALTTLDARPVSAAGS